MSIHKDCLALADFIINHGRMPRKVEVILRNGFRTKRMRGEGIYGSKKLLVRLSQHYKKMARNAVGIHKDCLVLADFIISNGRIPQKVEMLVQHRFNAKRMRDAGVYGPKRLLVKLAQHYREVA